MINIFNWVKDIDNKVDADNTTSKYFGSGLMLIAYLLGIILGFTSFKSLSIDFDVLLSIVNLLVILCIMLVVESVAFCSSTKGVILRSVITSAFIFLFYALGVLSSLALIVFALVVIGGLLLSIISFFNSDNKKGFLLSNGTKVRRKSGLLGEEYWDGDDGKSYTKNSDGTFSEN